MAFGTELYSVLKDYSNTSIESAKMFIFFESLIMHHSLETLIASTVNTITPRANNVQDYSSINMWYNKLDDVFKFDLGPAIAIFSTTKQQDQMAVLGPPFWNRSKLEECEQTKCLSGR